VLFGTTQGTHITVDSRTKLTVRVPAGTGTSYVTVVTAGGGPSALTGHAVYNWLQTPKLTGVSPASGRAKGGTTVTIRGTHFSYVQAVYFGKKRGTHLMVISPTKLTIAAPAGKGTVNIRVITGGGTTTLVKADRFTY
jgi:IPT/TIG domain-containing protein